MGSTDLGLLGVRWRDWRWWRDETIRWGRRGPAIGMRFVAALVVLWMGVTLWGAWSEQRLEAAPVSDFAEFQGERLAPSTIQAWRYAGDGESAIRFEATAWIHREMFWLYTAELRCGGSAVDPAQWPQWSPFVDYGVRPVTDGFEVIVWRYEGRFPIDGRSCYVVSIVSMVVEPGITKTVVLTSDVFTPSA